MRVVRIAAAGLLLAALAAAAAVTAVGASHHQAFTKGAAALEQRWEVMADEGVPAATIAPLRTSLRHSDYAAGWWAPVWWTRTGSSALADLQRRSDSAWQAALTAAREKAKAPQTGWEQLMITEAQYVPADAVAAQRTWAAELQKASTPAQIDRLVAAWSGNVAVARHAADYNQLNAQVSSYGGLSGLLAKADAAATTARRDNLDAGAVPALAAGLRVQLRSGADATKTVKDLLSAMQTLRTLISLNNNVAAGLHPLMLLVDQAAAEQTTNAQSFLSQFSDIRQKLHDATQSAQLSAVGASMASLQTTVQAELATEQCGHSVGSAKVIALNLTLQEMIFYQDGCAVNAAPTTTGRQYLRTPAGTFHVFYKASPFTMVSPWPPGSPFWYPTGTVTWVMEFASGGYFIHDAYWEANSQYGPGSQDGPAASHGCVHIPTPIMRWAYQWTPVGTPVIITY